MMLARKKGVHDLNATSRICRHAPGWLLTGNRDERRQDAVRTGDGLRAVENIWSHRDALRWRPRRSHAQMRRTASRTDVCSIDIPNQPARSRSLTVGSGRLAVSHEAAPDSRAFDSVRRAGAARLAHLLRTGPAVDYSRPQTVRPGTVGRSTGRYRIRIGRHDHRP